MQEKRADYLEEVEELGRAVKTGKRIPILVAQGIWPDTGQEEVPCWAIGEAEDQVGICSHLANDCAA